MADYRFSVGHPRGPASPRVALAAALVIAVSAIGGCSGTGTTASSTPPEQASASTAPASTAPSSAASQSAIKPLKTIAFATTTLAGDVFVEQQKQFQADADKLGIKLLLYNNNGTAQDMLSNATSMVEAKPDLIIEYPSDAGATARVADIFKQSGIPCISENVPVPGCPLFNFDQPYLAGLSAKWFAADMANRGWDGTNTVVVIGQGSFLGPSVNIAVETFYSELSKLVPNMQAVEASAITATTTTIVPDQGVQIDSGLLVDTAFKTMSQALQTIPQGKHLVVYTISDDSTKGALRAAATAGRTDVIGAGYGGDADSLNSIRTSSTWVADALGFFNYWPEFMIAQGTAMTNGVTPPDLTAPPMIVIDKSNVDKYYNGVNIIKMPALPQASQYLLQTGILQQFGNVEGATP